MYILKNIFIIILCVLFVSACNNGQEQRELSLIETDTPPMAHTLNMKDTVGNSDSCASSRLKILFTGDVLLDRGVRKWIERKGVEWLFEGVKDEFHRADAVVINLECPLTDTISAINKKYIFRAEAKWAKDLKKVGVTHAAMSNNHTNDQGRRGLQATNHHLLKAGIVPIGYGMNTQEQVRPAIIEKDGIRVAVFNSVAFPLENWMHLENRPGICQLNPRSLSKEIKKYKSENKNTFIVVVLHWGIEFQSLPTRMQRGDAHLLAESGADVIIGHHPHVLQPVDTINHTPVYYSIGNFVFDQSPSIARKSVIASVEFSKNGVVSSDIIPITIEQCRPIRGNEVIIEN